MLSDFENLEFEDLDGAKEAFKKLLGEAQAIKQNADRAVNQRKNDQETFRAEIDDLKKKFGEALKDKEDLENKGLINEGNFEELLEKKTEKMRLSFEEKFNGLTEQLTESQNNYVNLQSKYNSEKIGSSLRKAAETAGVLPTAIDDVVSRANGVFTIGQDGTIEARDSDGNILKYRNKVLTPEVFVSSLKEKAPHFWPVSEGAGAGGTGGSKGGDVENPFSKKHWNLTEQARISNTDPALAKELAQAAKTEAA